LQIITSSTPPHLRITQSMYEDFLIDPVTAARWIFNRDFDAFQAFRFKMLWWVPWTMDDSGVSTGKTLDLFCYANLRPMLLVNYARSHDVGVYYQTFEAGKANFWPLYTQLRAPLFQAQLGDVDNPEKAARIRNPSCWIAKFKIGGQLSMPSPDVKGEAAGSAGRRFNTLVMDEWTKWEAAGDGIDAEVIDRNSGPSFNERHPLWANHYKFFAHAEPRSHPSTRRYDLFRQRVRDGSTRHAIISFSYKDYSELPDRTGRTYREQYRKDGLAQDQRDKTSAAEFAAKYLGLRMEGGAGWYSAEALSAAQERGRVENLLPCLSRREVEQLLEEGERLGVKVVTE
jgi:hypothetical protein